MVDIKFHCDEKGNFRGGFMARAFAYTNYSIESHNHDFYEVNIVLSGTGIHCIENGRFATTAGDVFVIPPMVAHSYTDTDRLEVYHILLKKSFIRQNKAESERVPGFLQLTEIEPFLRGNSSEPFFLHLDQLQMIQLKNELAFIDDSSCFSWEECAYMKYHGIWKLLYWFSALLNRQVSSQEATAPKQYERFVLDALEYMHQHYNEKITIDTLCKKEFLSRSTFLRAFKQLCHTSPMEYLAKYRSEKAIDLLTNTNCSKTVVAQNCGFYDLSHMMRVIKKYGHGRLNEHI